jgi:hypothetical protein
MISACRSRLASLAGSARPLALAAYGAALVGAGASGLVVGGCTPSIGSSCELSTDCSSQGDRVCDTAEPNGYCTVQNCKPNECPDEAACVEFNASVPGCPYSDRDPSRLSVSFCMAQCHSDGDCRSDTDSTGRRLYTCADPRLTPWHALILDDDQTQKTCLPTPDPGVVIGSDAGTATFDDAVCQIVSPVLLDASAASDGGAGDAGDTPDATVLDAGASDAAGD